MRELCTPWALLLIGCLAATGAVGTAGCAPPPKPKPPRDVTMPPEGPQPSPEKLKEFADQQKAAADKEAKSVATPDAKPAGGKAAPADKTIVKITTPKGVITCELYDKLAPITVGSFLLLAEKGFYDGLTFHRIEPGFCAQGGDPEGTGGGGPGFSIPDEVTPELKHDKGMLSMAKTAMPNTGGSQFFICLGGPETVGHLDMKHAVFGKVIDGLGVAEKLAKGDKMEKVKIVSEAPGAAAAKTKAKAARKPD